MLLKKKNETKTRDGLSNPTEKLKNKFTHSDILTCLFSRVQYFSLKLSFLAIT